MRIEGNQKGKRANYTSERKKEEREGTDYESGGITSRGYKGPGRKGVEAGIAGDEE